MVNRTNWETQERIRVLGGNENLIKEIVADANKSSNQELKILSERKKIQERKLTPLKQNMENWLQQLGRTKDTDIIDPLLKQVGEANRQIKEIEHEIMEIELQIKESNRKVLDAEVMQDSLVKFSQLFDMATDEEKKFLIQLIVHKVIWTPTEVKYALYDRPTDTGKIDATPMDQKGSFALEVTNWLPG